MMNALTIDVESWVYRDFGYDGHRFDAEVKYCCLENQISHMLSLLEHYGAVATWFFLGEVQEHAPKVLEEVARTGQEIAFHTYAHKPLRNTQVLLKELEKSKRFISDFKPRGFRAPWAYITRDAFPVLARHGFRYSSSTYGPFNMRKVVDGVLEVPASSLPIFPFRRKCSMIFPRDLKVALKMGEIPYGSGSFLGLLGRKAGWFIKRANKMGAPSIILIHPWQVAESPVSSVRFRAIPYYRNVNDAFKSLLERFSFTSIFELMKDMGIEIHS